MTIVIDPGVSLLLIFVLFVKNVISIYSLVNIKMNLQNKECDWVVV